jgi:hypothetical protein
MNSTLEYQRETTGDVALKTDEELLLAYRENGEVEAFEALVGRYERELFSYLRRKDTRRFPREGTLAKTRK